MSAAPRHSSDSRSRACSGCGRREVSTEPFGVLDCPPPTGVLRHATDSKSDQVFSIQATIAAAAPWATPACVTADEAVTTTAKRSTEGVVMFSPFLVYTVSAIAAIVGVILVIVIVRMTMSPARMTVLSLIAGFCFGIVTNVATTLLLQPVDSGSVSLDPIRDQVVSGLPIELTGRAKLPAEYTLWIIAYRPGGGFEIESRQPVPVNPEGLWTFQPFTIGRLGQDANQVYTVSAVILDKAGAASITSGIASSPDPADVFIGQPSPDGLRAQSTQQVKLALSAASDVSPSTTTSRPSTAAPPPQTTCPPAGQSDATVAEVVRLQSPDSPLRVESVYYKAKLAGKVQFEAGGQLAGGIPSGKHLFMLQWADPSTVDSTPKHGRGNGVYYQLSTFRVSGNCFLRPQNEIAYDAANGLKFRCFLVLVDDQNLSGFMAPGRNANGYDDQALDSLGVTRIAYFDVPTKNL